eukprot:55152-Prymnesium_polylepis.1
MPNGSLMVVGRLHSDAIDGAVPYSWVVSASHATSQTYRRAPTMSAPPLLACAHRRPLQSSHS